MKRDFVLVLCATLLGLLGLAAGTLYFGTPAFGLPIIAAIFLIYLWASLRALKFVSELAAEAEVLKAASSSSLEALPVGIVAERVADVRKFAESATVSVASALEIMNAKFALRLGRNAGGVVILIGLLGTFFGLLLSISTAGNSIDNSSTAATMSSIQSIFSSMKGIFGTSLCGIYASIFLTAIHAVASSRASKFGAELDIFTVAVLFPKFAKKASADGGEAFFQKLSDAVAASQAEILRSTKAIADEVGASLKAVSGELALRYKEVSELHAARTEAALAEFSSGLLKARESGAEQAAQLLASAREGLGASAEASLRRLETLENSFGTALALRVSELTEKLSGALRAELEAARERSRQDFEAVSHLAEELGRQNSTQTELLSKKISEELAGLAAGVSKSFGELASASAEHLKAEQEAGTELLQKSAAQAELLAENIGAKISGLSTEVSEAFNKLSETSGALLASQKALLEQTEARVSKEREASEALSENAAEAAKLMRVNQSEFAAGLEMFNKGLEALLEKLSGDSGEKEEEAGLLEQVRRSLEVFHDRASEILLENAVKTQEILLEILEQAQRPAAQRKPEP